MLEVSEIKKNYKRYDDNRIVRIAKNESKGLRDDVIPILIEEIKRRKLGENLIEWINAERRILSKNELEELKAKIKACICTDCGEKSNLKGYKIKTIISYLFNASITDRTLIICEDCGSTRKFNSGFWTAIFGWWSIKGLFSTPFILYDKVKSSIFEDQQSEEIIESLIKNNTGAITISKGQKPTIQHLIIAFNRLNTNGHLEGKDPADENLFQPENKILTLIDKDDIGGAIIEIAPYEDNIYTGQILGHDFTHEQIQVFTEYENLINEQVISLTDELEEKISAFEFKIKEEDWEIYDLQIWELSNISFRIKN